MIELRTFQSIDKGCPAARKYLTLAAAPGGFAVQFYAPSAAEAQDAAAAWVAAERQKAGAGSVRPTPRRALAKAPKPQPETAAS